MKKPTYLQDAKVLWKPPAIRWCQWLRVSPADTVQRAELQMGQNHRVQCSETYQIIPWVLTNGLAVGSDLWVNQDWTTKDVYIKHFPPQKHLTTQLQTQYLLYIQFYEATTITKRQTGKPSNYMAIVSTMNQMLKSTVSMEPLRLGIPNEKWWKPLLVRLHHLPTLPVSSVITSTELAALFSFIYKLQKQIISSANLSSLAFVPILTPTDGGFTLFRSI